MIARPEAPAVTQAAVGHRGLGRVLHSETSSMLLDQALVSGGNFLTTLVLARILAPAEYGLFSLFFLALFGINTCHSSLVVYPLTIRGAAAEHANLPQLTSSALLHTLALGVPLACLLGIVPLVLHRPELCLPLGIAMLAWQLQETTRRILLASRQTRFAILPDAVCYLGQAAVVIAVRPSSLAHIFLIFAATSLLAWTWQLAFIGFSASREHLRAHAMYSWQMGRYVLGGNLLNMLSLQMPSWGLAAFAGGSTSVAGYQSLLNLVGVANPIIFSASNMLIPAVAREAVHGVRRARTTVLREGSRYGLLLIPCFAALCIAPHAVMQFVYGASSPYLPNAGLLRPFVFAFALQYGATVVGAYEGGMSRPRTYLLVQIASTAVLATAGLLLVRLFGVAGAVEGMLLAAATRLLVSLVCAANADKHLQRQPMHGAQVMP